MYYYYIYIQHYIVMPTITFSFTVSIIITLLLICVYYHVYASCIYMQHILYLYSVIIYWLFIIVLLPFTPHCCMPVFYSFPFAGTLSSTDREMIRWTTWLLLYIFCTAAAFLLLCTWRYGKSSVLCIMPIIVYLLWLLYKHLFVWYLPTWWCCLFTCSLTWSGSDIGIDSNGMYG